MEIIYVYLLLSFKVSQRRAFNMKVDRNIGLSNTKVDNHERNVAKIFGCQSKAVFLDLSVRLLHGGQFGASATKDTVWLLL